jgi:hypothetical protein
MLRDPSQSRPSAPADVSDEAKRHGSWERWALLVLAAVGLAGIIFTGFFAPKERPTTEAVSLLSGLAWPYVALAAIIAFHLQVGDFLAIIVSRVRSGSSLSIAKVLDLGAATERVPAAAPGNPVTLANIALLHSTWYSDKDTIRMNSGMKYYRVDVVVIAKASTLQRIESVTYRLPETWPEKYRIRTTTEAEKRFLMKELLNGTAIVTAQVRIKGQAEPLLVNRFLDIRADGQRLA